MYVSTTKNYYIQHFKLDDSGTKVFGEKVDIPENLYPSSVSAGHNLVSRSWNNAYGVFKDIPIANKIKINWKFDAGIASDVCIFVYNNIIKKIATGSRFFRVNTWAPGYGWIYADCYLGTPTQFETDGVGKYGEAASISYELHWIEIGDDTTILYRNNNSGIDS